MLIFKLDFLGFYTTLPLNICLKCFSVSKRSFDPLTQVSDFLKSSKVDFSIFRPKNLGKSKPMYAYKRYAYKKKKTCIARLDFWGILLDVKPNQGYIYKSSNSSVVSVQASWYV